MLYDILSPLVFFFSLGGIILIVARVVIRLRREELSTSIKSAAAVTPSPDGALFSPTARDVSQLLKPSQKSVHALRSRFTLLAQSFSQTRQGISSWRDRRKTARADAAPQPEPNLNQLPATPLTATDGKVVAPVSRKLGRLAFWRREKRNEIVASSTPEIRPSEPTPVTVTRRVTVETKPDAVAAPSVPQPVVTPAPAATPATQPAPAAAAVEKPERTFTKSLLRRVQGKHHPTPSALQAAAVELNDHHYQAAEDMLVPYIVKHPKDTAAYMLLGQAALGRESWEEAMEIFEQVITWNRRERGAYAGLGNAAYHAGRFTRALEALQRAHDAEPTNVVVLEQLLSIAEKMDNPALQHSIRSELEELRTTSAVTTT